MAGYNEDGRRRDSDDMEIDMDNSHAAGDESDRRRDDDVDDKRWDSNYANYHSARNQDQVSSC